MDIDFPLCRYVAHSGFYELPPCPRLGARQLWDLCFHTQQPVSGRGQQVCASVPTGLPSWPEALAAERIAGAVPYIDLLLTSRKVTQTPPRSVGSQWGQEQYFPLCPCLLHPAHGGTRGQWE